MKGRFPSDLLIVVFGPVLVVAIALGFGSVIYRASQWGRGSMTSAVVALVVVSLLAIFFLFRRRHRSSVSRDARDESTRNI